MKKIGKRLCALLLMAAMLLSLLPAAAFAANGQVELVTPQCAVTVSSEAADNTGQGAKEKAVDGDLGTQWSSANMKNGTGADQVQTPQWLTVDLGEGRSYPVAIDSIKLCYNMKVWPMVYKVETSANGTDGWATLVSVSRSPYDGGVKNSGDQDIASEPTGDLGAATGSGANNDTITKTTTPALAQDAAVQRYVRFYVEKVNTSAPGNNTGLREIQIYAPESAPEPIEGAWNLAQGQPVDSSGVTDGTNPADAVNGNTADVGWHSGNLKAAGVVGDDTDQEDQWLQIDLGAAGSRLSQIKVWYADNKVWPMLYRFETTDTPADAASWRTIVSVSRGSADKKFSQLTAAEGLAIADTASCADVIAAGATPGIDSTAAVGRYIRFYVEKTNAKAPGQNVNIREIEIYGVNDNRHTPVDPDAVLALATDAAVSAGGSAVTLPDVPEGAALTVAGSVLENVVANDGTISRWNIGARDVTLLLRAWDIAAYAEDSTAYVQKNLTVTVPDHKANYPAEWFPAVSTPNAKPEVIPAIQEWYGYTGSFTLTEGSRIVINDAAGAGLQRAAENMKADVLEISGIDLPIVTGTSGGAGDIYIESLTTDRYDLGDEGYLMRVSGGGIQIYAPTYTGCIFGTITVEQILWQAEDHVSVPMGIMRDYPAYEVRGVKLDIARTPYRYEQLQDYAKIMLWYKMSEYDLHINDNDNANIAKGSATMDTHSGFHRLESVTFPSLTSETKHAGIPADLVNADYYNNNADYQGNPTYTKAQWRALEQLAQDYGMYLLTEIDMPGHSLLYNKYAAENPDHIDWLEGGIMPDSSFTANAGYLELLDLTGANKDRALRFATTLWDEYTRGDQPTIYGDVVHIGVDEYWVHNEQTNPAFANFANEMRKVIQGNLGADTKIRMWGASLSGFATAAETLGMTHEELARHFQLDVWHTNYENPAQRAREGYGIVNCRDSFLYGNPGRSGRDVPNAEYLFNGWNPTMFGGNNNPMLGEPNLLGAKAVIWGDQSQEGMTERDIHLRVLRAIAIISEKTWGGATRSEGEFSDYELRFHRLAEGPGAQIAMEIPSETSLVLDYDFANVSTDGRTVYDASGNGYDASLTGGAVDTVDGDSWLAFNGSTLLTTDLKTLSYPYTVSFQLKADAGNTAESSLFSGYDGRIQAAGHNGHMSADVNYFTRDFNYTAPTDGTAVDVTIVGTQQATRLYVDGRLVTFLSQKADDDGVAPGSVQTLCSSVLLPLEKIGQGFHGKLANIKVYNKAFSAAEVADAYAGTDDNLVNVAQNAIAGGSSYEPGDGQDNNVQRVCTAVKAIDGEAFTDSTDASSEMWSYWRGDHAGSALTVDLGQLRTISWVDLQWRAGGIGSGFKIQTSTDGKTWTDAETISGNSNARQTINLSATQARFVRMQGVSGTYNLQEMLVYENVSALKEALGQTLASAENAAEFRNLGFESVEAQDRADFADIVFARAVLSSPLSTRAEVERAIERLGDQLGVPVTGITLEPSAATIYTNEGDPAHTVELTAAVLPDNAANRAITWSTSDSDVATVHQGVVTGNGVGTAVITAAAADGSGVSAACTVTVKTKLVYNIEITGEAKYDCVLTAQLNQLQMPEADKNNMRFQWYRTGGDGVKEAITGAAEQSYRLVEEDIGKTISVKAVPADPYEGEREASITGTVQKADGLRLVAAPGHENCVLGDDGVITGLFKGRPYEYKLVSAPDTEWTRFMDDTGDETDLGTLAGTAVITGLAPGSYHVRRAETSTHTAGPVSYTITILSAADAANAHDINIPRDFDGGRVLASARSAREGAEVILSVVPAEGRELVSGSLTVTGDSGAVIEVTPVTGADNEYKFVMPGEDVTVAAQFTTRGYTIIHALEHVTCSLGDGSSHFVPHGGNLGIVLTPEEGYQVPTNIQIVNTDTNEVFQAYTYRYNADRSTATITITGVTANLTIRGEGTRIVYTIAHELDNLVCSLPSGGGHRVEHGAALSITLTPSEGFLPPAEKDGITITMNGQPFSDFDYTVDAAQNTGTIAIAAGRITGSLEIAAAAVAAEPALSVELNRTAVSLEVDGTLTLSARVYPAGAVQTVTWTSSDPEVADVDENGVVTAKAVGKATITATTRDGRHSAECAVTVARRQTGVPSIPGGIVAPPPTTTTVVENPDGSKTTTVTDNRTGAVTETTERPDGATEVVETRRDGTVTATRTDPEGGKVEKVTTPEKDVTITVTNAGDEVLAKVEIPAELPTLDPDRKFIDVPDSHYAADAVNSMAALGIVNGEGGQIFGRENSMKRGDLAEILYRMSNGGDRYDLAFDDVPETMYYANSVAWAASTGVVTGYSETAFGPEDPITREQLAVMLYRYAQLLKLDTAASRDVLDAFTDGGSTHDWAEDGMAWCVKTGILQGRGEGVLDPGTNVIRADAALMFQRFIGLMK